MKYGVSIQHLKDVSGLPHSYSKPKVGSRLLVDRLQRLLEIHKYFFNWHKSVDALKVSKKEKEAMLITPCTYEAVSRLCLGVVGMCRKYIPHTLRRWVLSKFTQDPLESTFGQCRSGAGSHADMNIKDVNSGIGSIRHLGLHKLKIKRT